MRKFCEKSFEQSYCHERLSLEKLFLKGRIYEHRMFMKKNKLACWTIFLHIVDFLLHHLACVKSVKKAWDNLCATFEKSHVDNTLQLCQEFYNLKDGGKHFCVSSH